MSSLRMSVVWKSLQFSLKRGTWLIKRLYEVVEWSIYLKQLFKIIDDCGGNIIGSLLTILNKDTLDLIYLSPHWYLSVEKTCITISKLPPPPTTLSLTFTSKRSLPFWEHHYILLEVIPQSCSSELSQPFSTCFAPALISLQYYLYFYECHQTPFLFNVVASNWTSSRLTCTICSPLSQALLIIFGKSLC